MELMLLKFILAARVHAWALSSNHNAKQLILIRCKHSPQAARSFMRGLEIRLYSASGSPCLYVCFNAEISLICTCPRYKSRNVMIDSWTNLNSSQICLPLALGIEIFTKHTVLSSAMTMSIVYIDICCNFALCLWELCLLSCKFIYRVYKKKRNLGISQEIDIVFKTKDFRRLGI